MSIYSGFATRQQQQYYDQLVQDIIFVLQKRIIKFYNKQQADESKFLDVLVNLHQQMTKMQQSKYLDPKTSKSIQQLLKFLLKNNGKEIDELNKKNNKIIKVGQFAKKRQQYNHIKTARNTINIRNGQKKIRKQIQNSQTQQKLKNNKKSLQKLYELSPIGKIVKQINNLNENCNNLSESRNTFINKNKKNKNNTIDTGLYGKYPHKYKQEIYDNTLTQSEANPQDNIEIQRKYQKIQTGYIGKRNIEKIKDYNSETINEQRLGSNEKERERKDQIIIDYLQKNNKNYLKGIRRKSFRTKVNGKFSDDDNIKFVA